MVDFSIARKVFFNNAAIRVMLFCDLTSSTRDGLRIAKIFANSVPVRDIVIKPDPQVWHIFAKKPT